MLGTFPPAAMMFVAQCKEINHVQEQLLESSGQQAVHSTRKTHVAAVQGVHHRPVNTAATSTVATARTPLNIQKIGPNGWTTNAARRIMWDDENGHIGERGGEGMVTLQILSDNMQVAVKVRERNGSATYMSILLSRLRPGLVPWFQSTKHAISEKACLEHKACTHGRALSV